MTVICYTWLLSIRHVESAGEKRNFHFSYMW